jgi:hypothetical protein
MELLGDMGLVESHFGPFGDSVAFKIGARFVLNILLAQKSFWTHPIVLLGDEAQVDASFSLFDIVLILTQDRCMVCAECTKGS